MRNALGLTLLLLLLVPAVFASPAPAEVALPPELARVLRDYEAAWQKSDAKALASLFAEDGFVLSPGQPPVQGREAIAAAYQGRGGDLSLRALHFAVDGKVAYIIGGYTTKAGEPDLGKFTLTLKKDANGRWLIQSDMDNPNSRPKRPAQ
jgi:uncharacterized protein (TIGR02246 family)